MDLVWKILKKVIYVHTWLLTNDNLYYNKAEINNEVNMAKDRIQKEVSSARNTTTMVNKFLGLVQTAASENEASADEFFKSFKELYGHKPYYNDIKSSILEEMDLIGMDVQHIDELLWII